MPHFPFSLQAQLCTLALAASLVALTAGCSNGVTPGEATRPAVAPLHGKIYGGQQPVTGATIGLYAAGVNGATDGLASTSILNSGVSITTSDGTGVIGTTGNVSNSNNTLPAGYYNIDNSQFTCPSADPQVFLTASAGNPGLTAGTNNTAIQQMLPLGNCSTLATRQSAIINEATTVGMVAALYPYMTAYYAVGSTAAHASALVTAFNTAAKYIDASTGQSPGPALPGGMYASTNALDSLANSVASCVNTASYTTGDGGNCDKLFTYATPPAGATVNAGVKPTDTATAILDIRNNATNNVTNIFNLSSAVIAFAPTLASAPADWSLPIVVQPSTPTFSPAGGSYASAQTVTIANSDATAVLYYTTDGSTPTTSSTVYTGPLTVGTAETIQALAVESGRAFSAVGSATYSGTLAPIAPTVSLSAVTVPSGSTVPALLTSYSNATGSVVTFGKGTGVDGSFSAATCTIASGSCSVSYLPSGSLAAATYSAGLTASFAAYGSYLAATSAATLTVTAAAAYNFSLLASFTGTSGAASEQTPYYANLIQGSDGNFYGMTAAGGANAYGTVFKITSNGTFTLLHNFSNATTDGETPYGSLVQGSDGSFYGMTYSGGANSKGTVFNITSAGTFTVLHSFSTATTDGSSPYGGLVQGSDGSFYGMTSSGGARGYGSIFKVTSAGTFTLLHSFSTSINDGETPYGSLVQGSDGNFYGMTYFGSYGSGLVFKMTPAGTFTRLHYFSSATTDAQYPVGGLVQGSDGNFYGMTTSGGANGPYGAVFKITSTGTFTLVHSFSSSIYDGNDPSGNLVQGSDGNFYGMTSGGGANRNGTIFKMTSAGTVTLLHSFSTATTDGYNPYGSLVQGSDGSFYGMTNSGGANSDGTIFKLAVSPAFPAPVTLTVPTSVTHGATFTLGYAVVNATSTAGVTATTNTTLQSCQYFATNSAGTQVDTGALTAATTASNATPTAPATAGTYTYALTCGGMESGFATLNVQ